MTLEGIKDVKVELYEEKNTQCGTPSKPLYEFGMTNSTGFVAFPNLLLNNEYTIMVKKDGYHSNCKNFMLKVAK